MSTGGQFDVSPDNPAAAPEKARPATQERRRQSPTRLIAEPERWGILRQHFWGILIQHLQQPLDEDVVHCPAVVCLQTMRGENAIAMINDSRDMQVLVGVDATNDVSFC